MNKCQRDRHVLSLCLTRDWMCQQGYLLGKISFHPGWTPTQDGLGVLLWPPNHGLSLRAGLMFLEPPAHSGPGKSDVSSAPPLHPMPLDKPTWTLSQFVEHRQGGSGQMWGDVWGCAGALTARGRTGNSFPAGLLRLRPEHVWERPEIKLMKPEQEHLDWVCSFIHSFFIRHRPRAQHSTSVCLLIHPFRHCGLLM